MRRVWDELAPPEAFEHLKDEPPLRAPGWEPEYFKWAIEKALAGCEWKATPAQARRWVRHRRPKSRAYSFLVNLIGGQRNPGRLLALAYAGNLRRWEVINAIRHGAPNAPDLVPWANQFARPPPPPARTLEEVIADTERTKLAKWSTYGTGQETRHGDEGSHPMHTVTLLPHDHRPKLAPGPLTGPDPTLGEVHEALRALRERTDGHEGTPAPAVTGEPDEHESYEDVLLGHADPLGTWKAIEDLEAHLWEHLPYRAYFEWLDRERRYGIQAVLPSKHVVPWVANDTDPPANSDEYVSVDDHGNTTLWEQVPAKRALWRRSAEGLSLPPRGTPELPPGYRAREPAQTLIGPGPLGARSPSVREAAHALERAAGRDTPATGREDGQWREPLCHWEERASGERDPDVEEALDEAWRAVNDRCEPGLHVALREDGLHVQVRTGGEDEGNVTVEGFAQSEDDAAQYWTRRTADGDLVGYERWDAWRRCWSLL